MKDNLSEKFRKYLVLIIIDGHNLFLIWGTDLGDEEKDKVLINNSGKILVAQSYRELQIFLSDNEGLLFDYINFKNWLKQTRIRPYTTYNIESIESFIDTSSISLLEANKDICLEMLDFINLVGDYAKQVNDKKLLHLLKNKSISLFKDYVNLTYFWKASELDLKLVRQKIVLQFNHEAFRVLSKDIVIYFKSKLILV